MKEGARYNLEPGHAAGNRRPRATEGTRGTSLVELSAAVKEPGRKQGRKGDGSLWICNFHVTLKAKI